MSVIAFDSFLIHILRGVDRIHAKQSNANHYNSWLTHRWDHTLKLNYFDCQIVEFFYYIKRAVLLFIDLDKL